MRMSMDRQGYETNTYHRSLGAGFTPKESWDPNQDSQGPDKNPAPDGRLWKHNVQHVNGNLYTWPILLVQSVFENKKG